MDNKSIYYKMTISKIIILLYICLISCRSNPEFKQDNDVTDSQKLIKYVVEKFLPKQRTYFSICGNFFHEFSDSTMLSKIQQLPDSVISKKELNELVKQYHELKHKKISYFIDISNYKIIYKLDDYREREFYNFHYIISPPMFTKNNDTCLIYVHALVNKKGQTGVFLPFYKQRDTWIFWRAYLDANPNEEEGYHYHDYTLVDSSIFSSK